MPLLLSSLLCHLHYQFEISQQIDKYRQQYRGKASFFNPPFHSPPTHTSGLHPTHLIMARQLHQLNHKGFRPMVICVREVHVPMLAYFFISEISTQNHPYTRNLNGDGDYSSGQQWSRDPPPINSQKHEKGQGHTVAI